MSVFKNFQFKLSISDFQNSEHFIFRTSAKFNFRKFDRVGLRKNIADNTQIYETFLFLQIYLHVDIQLFKKNVYLRILYIKM